MYEFRQMAPLLKQFQQKFMIIRSVHIWCLLKGIMADGFTLKALETAKKKKQFAVIEGDNNGTCPRGKIPDCDVECNACENQKQIAGWEMTIVMMADKA